MIESPPSTVYPLRPDIEDYFAPANSNKLWEPNRLGGGGGRSGGLTKLYYQLVRGTNPGRRGRQICLWRTFLRWVQCVRMKQVLEPWLTCSAVVCLTPLGDRACGAMRRRRWLLCRRGETTYAMGWLKWGPTIHWWIRRREGAVKTAHRTHC
jgi:hypothetical protein